MNGRADCIIVRFASISRVRLYGDGFCVYEKGVRGVFVNIKGPNFTMYFPGRSDLSLRRRGLALPSSG